MKLKGGWEENLRRGVTWVGRALERAIKRIEQHQRFRKIPKVTPLLAIEGQLAAPRVKEMLQHLSLRLVGDLVPPLIDKTVLLVGDGVGVATPLCREKGASRFLEVEMASNEVPLDGNSSHIHSHAKQLAVASNQFDVAIGLIATPLQGSVELVLQHLCRSLVNGGELLVVDFHPFGLYAKKGAHRLRPAESLIRGVEDYFRLCRALHVEITDCREGFCDDQLRSFFVTPDEKQLFRGLKDTPLVFAFRGRKLERAA